MKILTTNNSRASMLSSALATPSRASKNASSYVATDHQGNLIENGNEREWSLK